MMENIVLLKNLWLKMSKKGKMKILTCTKQGLTLILGLIICFDALQTHNFLYMFPCQRWMLLRVSFMIAAVICVCYLSPVSKLVAYTYLMRLSNSFI